MRTLLAGDVVKLSGVPHRTLAAWCAEGVLRPTSDGRGTGHPWAFSLQQAVAVCYAQGLREHLRCGPGWALGALKFVAEGNPARLEEELAAGRVVVVPLPQPLASYLAPLTLPPDASPAAKRLAQHADLAQVWARVEREVEGLAPKAPRWRTRGLTPKKVKAGGKGRRVAAG